MSTLHIIIFIIFCLWEGIFSFLAVANFISYYKDHDDLGIPAGWFCVILVLLAAAIYGGVYWW